jgi:hypothetical protein
VIVTRVNEGHRGWDTHRVEHRGVVAKVHEDDLNYIDAIVYGVPGSTGSAEMLRIPHESIAAPPVSHPYWCSWKGLPE